MMKKLFILIIMLMPIWAIGQNIEFSDKLKTTNYYDFYYSSNNPYQKFWFNAKQKILTVFSDSIVTVYERNGKTYVVNPDSLFYTDKYKNKFYLDTTCILNLHFHKPYVVDTVDFANTDSLLDIEVKGNDLVLTTKRNLGSIDNFPNTKFNIQPFSSKYEYGTLYLIDKIGAYIDDCYNDSTLLKHQHYMPEGEVLCDIDYECTIERHYRDIWVHKEPTFVGFYEWLKNNQNGQ